MKIKWDFSGFSKFADSLNDKSMIEYSLKKLTKELAKEFLDVISNNTPVKTGKLIGGWLNGSNLSYRVVKVANGYEVTFTNKVEYAKWVNDGHHVKNREDGPYLEVHNRTVPYYSGNMSKYFVFGHFFVEKSIEEMIVGTHDMERIMYKHLQNWLKRCAKG